MRQTKGCLLFDWGDTLMRVLPEFDGPMQGWPRVEAVAGATETLSELHLNWKLALATNAADSNEQEIRAALRRVDLERWLDDVYCFKKIGHKKPSPLFFGHILKDLGLPPGQVIMVGDDYEVDVLGANRCGLQAIWFNEQSADIRQNEQMCTIHGLAELPRLMRNFIKPF
jgi:putative hydrolase of the HAD superfamily